MENVVAADLAKTEDKFDAKYVKEPKAVEEIQRVDQHQINYANDDVVDFPLDMKMGNDEDGDDTSEGWETVDGSDWSMMRPRLYRLSIIFTVCLNGIKGSKQ